MSLQVNVGSTALGDSDYETVLRLEGKAELKGETLFAFDLSYAGVFRLQNIPQEHVHPVLVIDCARLLFPFARQIIAEAAASGHIIDDELVSIVERDFERCRLGFHRQLVFLSTSAHR